MLTQTIQVSDRVTCTAHDIDNTTYNITVVNMQVYEWTQNMHI